MNEWNIIEQSETTFKKKPCFYFKSCSRYYEWAKANHVEVREMDKTVFSFFQGDFISLSSLFDHVISFLGKDSAGFDLERVSELKNDIEVGC
jgi:hypothetical protein